MTWPTNEDARDRLTDMGEWMVEEGFPLLGGIMKIAAKDVDMEDTMLPLTKAVHIATEQVHVDDKSHDAILKECKRAVPGLNAGDIDQRITDALMKLIERAGPFLDLSKLLEKD